MDHNDRAELLNSLKMNALNYLENNDLEVCGNLVILANQDIVNADKIIQSDVTLREIINFAILRYFDEDYFHTAIDFLNSFANGFMQDVSSQVQNIDSNRKVTKRGLNEEILPDYSFDVTLPSSDTEIHIQKLPLPEVWLTYQANHKLPFNEGAGFDLTIGREMYNDLVVMLHDEFFTGHTYLPFLPSPDPDLFIDLLSKKIIEQIESRGNIYFHRREYDFANKHGLRDINTIATEALMTFHNCPLTPIKGHGAVARETIKEIERRMPDGFIIMPSQAERFSRVGHQMFDWTNLSIYKWKGDAINFAQMPFVTAYAMTHVYPFIKLKMDAVSFNTVQHYNEIMDKIEKQVNDHFDPIYKQMFQEELEAKEKYDQEVEAKKLAEATAGGRDLSEYLKKPTDVPLANVEKGPGNSLVYSTPSVDDEFGNLDGIDFDAVAKKVDAMQAGGGEAVTGDDGTCDGCTI